MSYYRHRGGEAWSEFGEDLDLRHAVGDNDDMPPVTIPCAECGQPVALTLNLVGAHVGADRRIRHRECWMARTAGRQAVAQ